jgi:hypothetical protein
MKLHIPAYRKDVRTAFGRKKIATMHVLSLYPGLSKTGVVLLHQFKLDDIKARD